MKRNALRLTVGITVLAASAFLVFRLDRPLLIATGAVSHTLCSAAFVSGLNPQQVYVEEFESAPAFRPIRWAIRYNVDAARREVRTTLAGTFSSRAVYRDGLGCIVLRGDPPQDLAASTVVTPAVLRHEDPMPEPVDNNKNVLAVLDGAFALHPSAHWLKAVVVMRDGRVVAERYAPGYGPGTPVLGWSLTKSVTNALVGILVRQHRLKVEQPAPVPEWSDTTDPRHAITIDQLLRMTSGLDIAEGHTAFDPVSRMIFLERNMAGFAASARLRNPPGTTWAYSSGNYLILSRAIRDTVGGDAASVLDFTRRQLFEPLGITTATLEFDSTGTPIGSTYMLATARDWARFGTLYLHDGLANGQPILPPGWVRYSTTPTLDSGYAAGFSFSSRRNHELGVPPDAFFAEGFLGQELAIIPSEHLVVARFGVIDDDFDDLDPLVPAIISALHNAEK